MTEGSGILRHNMLPLSLHVPEPKFRPGDVADFSELDVSEAGATPRPEIDSPPHAIRELCYGLIRVLSDDGHAVGEWAPDLSPDLTRALLRAMMLTRAFDAQMFRAQRQGKTSFYMKSLGEEAVAVGAAFALNNDDMCFPSYRQQGLSIARDWSLVDMMNQIYSNRADRLKETEAIGRKYLGEKVDIAAQIDQPIVIAIEQALLLRLGHRPFV